MVHELDFLTGSPTNHDLTSRVLAFHPVQFAIGTTAYAYGFVYKVLRKVSTGATTADIFLDYWSSSLSAWSNGNLVVEDVDPDQPWSVVPWGRFVFVFVRGRGGAMFYVHPDTDVLTMLGDDVNGPFPGPGGRPALVSPERAVNLGSFADDPVVTERPGSGQIVLVSVRPSASYLYPGPDGAGYDGSVSSASASGSGATGGCDYPSSDDPRELEDGDYTFAYQLVDSRTGRKSAFSDVAQARREDFSTYVDAGSDSSDSGDDTYEYQDKFAVLELIYDSSKYDQAYVYRSVKVQDAGGTFVGAIFFLDKIIDLECLWTNRNGTGEDYDPALTDLRHIAYWYELEDKQLVSQEAYMEKPLFDKETPRAGAAHMYENTMLFSNVQRASVSSDDEDRPGDTLRGLGEIRWSCLGDSQPELVSPSSRYVPSVPGVEIKGFRAAGSNVIGFSAGRQFFLRKDSTSIRVVETHKGFGVVGSDAMETLGSVIYFLTRKGVKTVDASAQLDDIRSLNHLTMYSWAGTDLPSCSMAFDPAASALFLFNPAAETAAVIWFNSARVSELHDLPFLQVKHGHWPLDLDDDASELEERALWLQDYPRDTPTDAAATGWKPRVFVYDVGRTKEITDGAYTGDPRITTLDFGGDSRFDVKADFLSGTIISLDRTGGLVSPGDGVEGSYLYVVRASDPALVGQKAKIKRVDFVDAGQVDLELGSNDSFSLHGLLEGDRVVVGPVPVKWTGSPLAAQTPEGQDFGGQGFFSVRFVDTVGCSFNDVSGPPEGTADAFYFAGVYKGDETDLAAKGLVRSTADGTPMKSVVEGPGTDWAAIGSDGWASTSAARAKYGVRGMVLTPHVSVVCPDLDFRLMAVKVKGKVAPTERAAQHRTS